jgi:ATP-dependent helicase/nuclease subunit B
MSATTPISYPLQQHLLAPGTGFWPAVARLLLAGEAELSSLRVLVPTYAHISPLRQALAVSLGPSFIPPEIRTLGDWLISQPPVEGQWSVSAPGERLMGLYAQLREQAWLKKLFEARRNTDLLPLARTLISLSDELTEALLATALKQPDAVEDRWRTALGKFSPKASALLSSEAQLVWNIWNALRDQGDPAVVRQAQLQRLAENADRPLFWCSPIAPSEIELDFLTTYAQHQPVTVLGLDWSNQFLPLSLQRAWPELCETTKQSLVESSSSSPTFNLQLSPARHLEDEAQSAAQTIINWLQEGKNRILIVPQDRVVARRVRALLERARVFVSDETGWKLSTTRAAAVLASWLDLVTTRGRPAALLDFIKSPFLFNDSAQEAQQRLEIERALTTKAVATGWDGIRHAVDELPEAKRLIDVIAREAERYPGRKTVVDWVNTTRGVFDALGMSDAMNEDIAASQLIAMMESLAVECESIDAVFTLSEWRVLLTLQLEQAEFVAPKIDQRVLMVPLHGVSLRDFDAAIIVGGDADHLPSPPQDVLFFANAVRRELGLATREQRAQQQLRDFASLLMACPIVVLSWQSQINGESNLVSPWIQRLQLELKMAGPAELPLHEVQLAPVTLQALPSAMPLPSAPLLLPATLSASGYNTLVACPYQFFATRMLRLGSADELTDLPEKRDYGNWVHDLLLQYHQTVAQQQTPVEERAGLLERISEHVFDQVLLHEPAALPYLARWQKQIPAYLDWANAHQEAGWTFAFGERQRERVLSWGDGEIQLKGRLDRVDQNADGDWMVLDYKTTDKGKLKRKLAQREDHQLTFYGLLLEQKCISCSLCCD